jgi:hypothetical protein
MTRKHFAAVATAINDELRAAIGNQEHHSETAIRTVAKKLAAVEPAFNQARFLAACVKDTAR